MFALQLAGSMLIFVIVMWMLAGLIIAVVSAMGFWWVLAVLAGTFFYLRRNQIRTFLKGN